MLDVEGAVLGFPDRNKNWDIVHASGGITNTATDLLDGDVRVIDPPNIPVTSWRLRSK